MLLCAFQSTHPFSRYEVRRIKPIKGDELLVTYDYTSFTTSLSELKYFLWFVATQFEGVTTKVLDVHEGLREIDLGEYLHHYNETINHHQVFDTARILRLPEESLLFQSRNGSLGVGGNISFSGACHGVSLSGFDDDTDSDSVVGDDALLKILRESLTLLIIIVNKLGLINPDKVTSIGLPAHDDPIGPDRTSFKYLKRPIKVNHYGDIETGTLDFFPNIASCLFPYGDGIHDKPLQDIPTTVRSYIMQVGKFFTNLLRGHVSSDPDAELLLLMLRSVYYRYGLPTCGAVPDGSVYTSMQDNEEGQRISVTIFGNMWLPPLDTLEVFYIPWMDILYSRLRV